jgi:hypothetical protein
MMPDRNNAPDRVTKLGPQESNPRRRTGGSGAGGSHALVPRPRVARTPQPAKVASRSRPCRDRLTGGRLAPRPSGRNAEPRARAARSQPSRAPEHYHVNRPRPAPAVGACAPYKGVPPSARRTGGDRRAKCGAGPTKRFKCANRYLQKRSGLRSLDSMQIVGAGSLS